MIPVLASIGCYLGLTDRAKSLAIGIVVHSRAERRYRGNFYGAVTHRFTPGRPVRVVLTSLQLFINSSLCLLIKPVRFALVLACAREQLLPKL